MLTTVKLHVPSCPSHRSQNYYPQQHLTTRLVCGEWLMVNWINHEIQYCISGLGCAFKTEGKVLLDRDQPRLGNNLFCYHLWMRIYEDVCCHNQFEIMLRGPDGKQNWTGWHPIRGCALHATCYCISAFVLHIDSTCGHFLGASGMKTMKLYFVLWEQPKDTGESIIIGCTYSKTMTIWRIAWICCCVKAGSNYPFGTVWFSTHYILH